LLIPFVFCFILTPDSWLSPHRARSSIYSIFVNHLICKAFKTNILNDAKNRNGLNAIPGIAGRLTGFNKVSQVSLFTR
jgi:hypothetical protein